MSTIDGASLEKAALLKRATAALLRWRGFESLQHRDYRWLWLSSMLGFLAMNMQQVARGWLVYDMTGSAMALAWVMVSMALPMSVFSLIGGAITDRVPKRNLLGMTMVASLLVTSVVTLLIHAGLIEFWHLMVAGVTNGIVISFQMPARYSFVPQLVGEERLINAISLSNAGMNLSRVLAPALAGLLITVVGVAGVFDVMVALYFLGAVSVLFMHHRGEATQESHGGLMSDIVDGVTYVRRNTLVLALLTMAFIPLLFGFPYMLLLPAFAVEALSLDANGLGLLMAITGIGAIVGSMVVAYLGNFNRMGLVFMGAAALWGVALMAFSQSPNLVIAVLPLALTGLANAVYMSLNLSLIQMHAEPHMRGRVMSIFMWTFSLMPLGLIPVSFVAEWVGTPTAFLGSGLLLILTTTAMFALVPSIRRLGPIVKDEYGNGWHGGGTRSPSESTGGEVSVPRR